MRLSFSSAGKLGKCWQKFDQLFPSRWAITLGMLPTYARQSRSATAELTRCLLRCRPADLIMISMLHGIVYPVILGQILAAILALLALGWKYRKQVSRNVHNGFWWSLWKIRIIKRETYIKRTRHIIAIIGDDRIYDRD